MPKRLSRAFDFIALCLMASTAWFFAGCAFAVEVVGSSTQAKGRVLVAFSTSKGSTGEVAETIASEIRSAGWEAEAVNLNDVHLPEEFNHVILGGPVYYGKIREVKAFVEKYEEALRDRLTGAFAVGMAFAVDDEEQIAAGRKALDDSTAPLRPAHLGYFAGRIDPGKLSLLEKAAIKMVKSPVGDFRDWEEIRAWAREVVKSLDQ